jgi:hypothetical protein
MHSHYTRATLTASVALAMLAGCSGGSGQMSPNPIGLAPGSSRAGLRAAAQTPAFAPAAEATPLIFVTDERKNIANIYLQAGSNQKIGEIKHLHRPLGLTTDRVGNVYIPDNQKVLIYSPPYTAAPTSTLNDSGEFPYNVAVSRTGVVGVVNVCKAPSCALDTPSVTFFAKNSTKPCVTVDTTDFALLEFDAFDHKGNLFVRGRNSAGYQTIGEVSGGCRATKIMPLSTSNTIIADGGIKIDDAGRIAVLGAAAGSTYVIDTYNPPVSGSLGAPVSTTPLMGLQSPTDFAFLASGADLYVADFLGATVDEYAYPAGGPAENVITDPHGLPSDVAVIPPLVP